MDENLTDKCDKRYFLHGARRPGPARLAAKYAATCFRAFHQKKIISSDETPAEDHMASRRARQDTHRACSLIAATGESHCARERRAAGTDAGQSQGPSFSTRIYPVTSPMVLLVPLQKR